MAYHNHKPNNLSLEEVPQFSGDRQVGCEKGILAENWKYLWNSDIEQICNSVWV